MLVQASGAPICVCELTAALGLPQQNVSYHLKQLLDAGVVSSERRGRYTYYALVPDALAPLAALGRPATRRAAA